jgi:hypothetical protein
VFVKAHLAAFRRGNRPKPQLGLSIRAERVGIFGLLFTFLTPGLGYSLHQKTSIQEAEGR